MLTGNRHRLPSFAKTRAIRACNTLRRMLGGETRSGRAALLAESRLYGHALAPLGATARQHRLTGLGLHTGTKPVRLTPPPAVRLKRALRHLSNALLRKILLWSKPKV